jgi:hypothetical protein
MRGAGDPQWHIERGVTRLLTEMPPDSIALDGYVSGPAVDAEGRRFSFDHHGDCVRHATLSACEQVRDALAVGLDPRGMSVWLNNVDADSVLALWLLLRRPTGDRVEGLVHQVGRRDALGPGWSRERRHALFLPARLPAEDDRRYVERALASLDRWLTGDRGPEDPLPERAGGAIYLLEGRAAHLESCAGFPELYEHADFGVLYAPADAGTTAYTVGKRSEFVAFDVRGFLEACRRIEPGWGGASTIGGAPRQPDGRRSELPLERVAELLADCARPMPGIAPSAPPCR